MNGSLVPTREENDLAVLEAWYDLSRTTNLKVKVSDDSFKELPDFLGSKHRRCLKFTGPGHSTING